MGRHSHNGTGRPLLICGSDQLLDALLAIANTAGIETEVAPDAISARSRWSEASVVLVDSALIDSLVVAALPRRSDVIVVGADLDDADIWRRALQLGAGHVVFLPEAGPWLASTMVAAAVGARSGDVIAIVGGTGGVGASTAAATLARHTCDLGRSVALVDADPRSARLDLLLGVEDEPGARWPDLSQSSGYIDPDSLLDALPDAHGVSLLTWDDDVQRVPATAMTAAVSALVARCEVVVVDLGRAQGEAVEPLLALSSLVVMIVPARVRAVASARRLLPILAPASERLQLIVRMPSPGGLDPVDIQQSLGLPLLGEIAHDSRRAEYEEHGIPPRLTANWQRLGDAILSCCGESRRVA
jgi:secretion/DNA translocation related CpaE-like protein